MKKLLITLSVLLGLTGAAKAETLQSAYEKIAAVAGSKTYDREDTDKNLAELNSSLPMESYTSVQWTFEKGSEGVTKAFYDIQSMLSNVDNVQNVLSTSSNYNNFDMLVATDGNSQDLVDVMAIWQMNYYGLTYVVYGKMTEENLNRLMFGKVVMDHYGVSVNPMPRKFYEEYVKLGNKETILWKDQAEHKTGEAFKQLDKKFNKASDRLKKEVEKAEKSEK